MLMAAGEPDGDGPTGWATDPATLLMLFCPLMYFIALGLARLRRRTALANASQPPNQSFVEGIRLSPPLPPAPTSAGSPRE